MSEEMNGRALMKYEEAMRKKDERRVRLQIERDALIVVLQLLTEELTMLRKSYEKDSRVEEEKKFQKQKLNKGWIGGKDGRSD